MNTLYYITIRISHTNIFRNIGIQNNCSNFLQRLAAVKAGALNYVQEYHHYSLNYSRFRTAPICFWNNILLGNKPKYEQHCSRTILGPRRSGNCQAGQEIMCTLLLVVFAALLAVCYQHVGYCSSHPKILLSNNILRYEIRKCLITVPENVSKPRSFKASLSNFRNLL